EPAGVDRDQDVGGAVAAFGLDARQQLVAVVFDPIDRDPGLLGERAVELFVGLIVPGRVDVDLRRQRSACAAGEERSGQRESRWTYPDGHVASSVDAVVRMRKPRIREDNAARV